MYSTHALIVSNAATCHTHFLSLDFETSPTEVVRKIFHCFDSPQHTMFSKAIAAAARPNARAFAAAAGKEKIAMVGS
jgi:hypothetical protein